MLTMLFILNSETNFELSHYPPTSTRSKNDLRAKKKLSLYIYLTTPLFRWLYILNNKGNSLKRIKLSLYRITPYEDIFESQKSQYFATSIKL